MTTPAQHFLDGRLSRGGALRESNNPSTGQPIGTFADGGAQQAAQAIAAARAAFDQTNWAVDRNLRAAVLNEIADVFARRRDEVIALLSLENGKIRGEAVFEVDMAIPKLRYFAAMALTDHGATTEPRPGVLSMVTPEPTGVAGIIVPWNSPVILAIRSFAPALAAGCTVAMKMPAQTGLVNGLLHEILAEVAQLPPGVLNSVTESGNVVSEALVASPDVDVISYTGSTAVGRVIAANGAATMKRLSLELGGKSPMIVFADADLDAAVPVLTKAITVFAGQFCMAGSRILVERKIAAELRQRLATSLESVHIGPGADPASQMGPMIDAASADRVVATVDKALGSAKPIVAGGRITDGPLAAGAFVKPALLEVEDVHADIVQREVFGPVATFEVFDDESDAVARANATEFGLAASVWTCDLDRPRRVGRQLRVGTVWFNTWAVVTDQGEEGGFKQSGLGRLNGQGGLQAFQELKHYVHTVGAGS